ncbi:uncharacterized protein LOC114528963 [Dendronephthya gigantea]|uniref:uncharacterized protein LOC114528963 n=1 Tax=Dendronephthya gigantea TaxID=151771 RepID=UPI00106A976D|nr:uncharacterized protein LOC114528963 [Dendronephthya gigantea]
MKVDGGGWTMVSNLVLKQPKGMNWTLANDYQRISEYEKQKLALSTEALRDLGSKMSFNQIRFFCRKKIPGRIFDITTNKTNSLGQEVIKYFTTQANTPSKSCGSYYRLPDDNSILASQCSQWGRESDTFYVGEWHNAHHDHQEFWSVKSRLFNHTVFVGYKAHWLTSQSLERWECDDFKFKPNSKYTLSPNDFWKIFVR